MVWRWKSNVVPDELQNAVSSAIRRPLRMGSAKSVKISLLPFDRLPWFQCQRFQDLLAIMD